MLLNIVTRFHDHVITVCSTFPVSGKGLICPISGEWNIPRSLKTMPFVQNQMYEESSDEESSVGTLKED